MKRYFILILLLIFPLISNANSSRSGAAPREYMQQRIAYLKKCHAEVDKPALEKVAQNAQALKLDIKQLCKEGKQAEAAEKALAFGRMLSLDKNVKAAQGCRDIFEKQLMPLDFPTNKTALKNNDLCAGNKP